VIQRLHAYPAAALLCLALAAGGAHAADAADPFDCNPNGNQQEINACAVRDFHTSDAKLNNRYREVMAALPTDKRMALRQEQREWIKHRDPGCKAQAKPNEGGSIWPLEFYGCLQKITDQRVTALNNWEGRR